MIKPALAALAALLVVAPVAVAADPLTLEPLGRVATGGAEIAAYHPASERAFVTDAVNNELHVIDLSDPESPQEIRTVDLSPYGGGPNSVAVSRLFGGLVAVAVEATPKTEPGSVVLFDRDGDRRGRIITAGALPDMLTFAPSGRTLLVANEGEPNDTYSVDPKGSVTVIDFARGIGNPRVRTAGFDGVQRTGPVRLFGFGSPSPAQDLEPEYIATDGERAWVTLQENNALGVLDVDDAEFDVVKGLGFKDHGATGGGLDASDRDNGLGSTLPTTGGLLVDNIFPRPGVRGMYQPDAIAAFHDGEDVRLVTANEGDARVYPPANIPGGASEGSIFSEEARVGGLAGLGFTVSGLPTGTSALGRLNITKPSTIGVPGLTQTAPATVTEAYAFGARSMTVWNTAGGLVADTGDLVERTILARDRGNFNKTSSAASALDDRSDNKGPEPEGVTVGRVAGTTYAFLSTERAGAILALDLSDAAAPTLAGYANTRPADLGPEGISFISAQDGPEGRALLLIANEISGTVNVLAVED